MNSLTSRSSVPLLSVDFLRHYVTTMRPYLLFVSGITGIVGISFHPVVSVTKAALLFIASFLSYGFGQALTDCTQTDTDALSSPYRPLPRGIISRQQVAVISVTGLIACVAVFAGGRTVNLALGILAGLGLATYTPFKRRWWSGPFYNAWIVTVLFIMAFLGAAADTPSGRTPGFIATGLAVFFGYANFVLSGYFKDIDADRQTGYRTIPVVFGRRTAAVVSDAFAVAFALSTACALISIDAGAVSRSLSSILWLAGAATLVVAHRRLHRVRTDAEAHRAIAPVVHAYLLLLAAISTANNVAFAGPLAVYGIGYLLVMKYRPAVDQI